MSRRKAEMVLELIDRATGPARRFIRTQERMGKAVEASNQTAARSARATDRAASRTQRALSLMAEASRRSFQTIVDGSRRAERAVGALHRKTIQLGKMGIGQIGQGWNRARGGLLAGAATVTLAYGAAAAAAGGLVGTASEFEKFQTILETTEGSSAAAQKAMSWVQDFAVTTPYELAQVTDGFVKLRAYGLDPTQGLMISLGDTAAAMGKPLGQAVEAMADAVMGENERLKEFGITASKAGERITYSYTNAAGQQMQAIVDAGDRVAIQQQLMEIMNEKYGGSMARLSATWAGMISNVLDLWTKFQMMIMNAGLFDWMKGKLREVLDTINQMEADGTLQAWAKSIGVTIQNALTQMWAFGTGVVAVFLELKGYLSSAAEYVGGWENLAKVLAGMVFAPMLISTAAGLVQIATGLAMLTTALLANPIILAIAAIAGGVYLIYRNWDNIGPYFQRIWDNISEAVFSWDNVLTVLNWLSYLSPIRWMEFIPGFKWSSVIAVFSWDNVLTVLNWLSYLSPIRWMEFIPGFKWSSVIAVFSWDNVLTVLTWLSYLSPIRWMEFIPGFKWSSVIAVFSWDNVLTVLNWLSYLSPVRWIDLIPKLELSEFIADFNWSDLLPDWQWSTIVPDIDLGQYLKRPKWLGGGVETVKALEISNPETLLEAARAAERLETMFPKISAAATAALAAANGALNSITMTFAAGDYTSEGARLIQSLATGMLAQKEAVRQAALAIGQTIRTALPSSANANITVSGAANPEQIQKRARGGSFGPGPLLTGEQGAELEYRTRGGYIAHNRALTRMAALSDKIANTNRRPAKSGWLKGAAVSAGIATSMAAVPAAAEFASPTETVSEAAIGAKYLKGDSNTSVSLSAPLTLTITGNVTPDVMTDVEARLTRHKEEIANMLEQMQRMKQRREHG